MIGVVRGEPCYECVAAVVVAHQIEWISAPAMLAAWLFTLCGVEGLGPS